MSAGSGRNDPCPCGSGRKFKHCCLGKADAVDQARVRVRRAEGRVVDALFAFALKRFGKQFFEHAWLDFWAYDAPDAGELSDIPEFETMFVPWFVTAFVRDPHGENVQPDWPDEPVGLHWLRTERPLVETLEREWLTAACASPMSVFTVEHVEPGTSLDIRDVFTGRHFHVLEQTASRTIRQTDLLFVRVVTAGGVSLMFGMAPLAVPAHHHLAILDWRDRVVRRRTPTRSDLVEFDVEIRDLYLSLADAIRHPVLPELRNTDGDPIELTTLVYDLAAPVPDAFERVRPLAVLGDDEHVSDMETDESGAMKSVVVSWVKAGNRKHKAWDNTILGTVRLEAGRLTAEVNSARRADRLERELKRRLGKTAVLRARSVDNVTKRLEDRAQKGERSERRGRPLDQDPERPPEFDVLEDRLYEQHLESWIDTRVPVLGHRTPRQAVRTARGRERVEALLAGFEGSQADALPSRRDALSALRRTLGLTSDPSQVRSRAARGR
jgi:hypothetical protein